MPASPEDKALKAFAAAAANREFNPYLFANMTKIQGGFTELMFREAALAVFSLGEIDYRYGLGDREWGEMCSRIVDVIAEYRDHPNR